MTISSIYGSSGTGSQNVTPSILSSTIDVNGNLVLVYANGAVVSVGRVVGHDGAQGAKGDKGDKGPAAVLVGQWASANEYKQGDMVYFGNSIFQALTDIPRNLPSPNENSTLWTFMYTRVPVVPQDSTSIDYVLMAAGGAFNWVKKTSVINSVSKVPEAYRQFNVGIRHKATSTSDVSGVVFGITDVLKQVTFSWVVKETEIDNEVISTVQIRDILNDKVYDVPASSVTTGVYSVFGIWEKSADYNHLLFVVTATTNTGKVRTYNAYIDFALPSGNVFWSGFYPDKTIPNVNVLTSHEQADIPDSLVVSRGNLNAGNEGTQCFAWVAFTLNQAEGSMPNTLTYNGFPLMYKSGTIVYDGIVYQMYRSTRRTGIAKLELHTHY